MTDYVKLLNKILLYQFSKIRSIRNCTTPASICALLDKSNNLILNNLCYCFFFLNAIGNLKKKKNFFYKFFWKKCQVFGNFLTVKWQFSGGSGFTHTLFCKKCIMTIYKTNINLCSICPMLL